MIKKQIVLERFEKKKRIYLDIYEGYDTAFELMNAVENAGLNKDYIVVIKFLDMYYGVFFESLEKEIIIGKNKVWFRDNYIMYCGNLDRINLPYKINSLKTHNNIWSLGVSQDLRNIDSNIKIFRFKKGNFENIQQYAYATTYLILLGITFYSDSIFFTKDEGFSFLPNYFGFNWNCAFKNPDIEAINPFKSLVRMKDGSVKKYRFY